MTKAEALSFADRMKGLDSSGVERALSTPERRLRQLDQIWLHAQAFGLLKPKPIDLSIYNLWARIHRGG
ncbi:MAG: hypothetical protein P4L46_09940 [Fimbriimonas sp.]|nr:hypothetical protein [Fimbriimonas sp.]